MSPLMSSLPRRQVGLSSRVKNSAFLLVGTLAVFLVAGLVSSVRSQAFLPANMADAMDASLFLNKFKSAVDQVGYADAIVDPNFAGTIFAPVDLGFDALLLKSNATWDQLIASNATLARLVNLHIVPDQKLFPLTTLKAGMRLKTHLEGYDLFVNRDTPGIVHIYAVEKPEVDPLNFATVLQYQEIKGGKAILYVVDKVMVPPAKPTAIAAADPAAAAAAKKQLKL